MEGNSENTESALLFNVDNLRLAEQIGLQLLQRSWLLGTAESCTGGSVAGILTEIPGSSQWFAGGLVTYSNEWKQKLLGVQALTLEKYGAVSSETVAEMLDGLLDRYALQAGIAVSGIAGPGGAVPGKPVGTVYIGVALGEERRVCRRQFSGDRRAVRIQSCTDALQELLRLLHGSLAS
ncbi:MAG: CinA family protein [Oligosphaeraceae bacterium]|nr:CinA family protein [Oligosphaeraceae bacterium]